MQADPDAVHSLFNELAKQKLIDWVSLAEERLNGTGIKCFVTGGNDDEWEVLNVMKQEPTKSFFACENEMVQVDEDHTMISVGYQHTHSLEDPARSFGGGTWRNDREDGGVGA